MGTIGEIQEAIKKLPRDEARRLWDWFFDYIEDELTITEKFQEEINAGWAQIADGRCRVIIAEPQLTDELLENGADLSQSMTNDRPAPAMRSSPEGLPD
jgi:hypothetical protein